MNKLIEENQMSKKWNGELGKRKSYYQQSEGYVRKLYQR